VRGEARKEMPANLATLKPLFEDTARVNKTSIRAAE
jgi:hypothetical protein